MKIVPEIGESVYHCCSRTVNKEKLFGRQEKEVFRRQLWQIADFCGVQVLTYAVMDNHFHVLVRIPLASPLPDAELLRRYEVLYPQPTKYQAARLSAIRRQLVTNGPDAVAWRKRQLALMSDVSQFMKLLKQRFSIWFNRHHHRCGTLWSERFKSSLIEPVGHARLSLAAYVDLNPIRAGMVEDPLHYRFCGYAEAVAGSDRARQGLMQLTGCREWNAAQAGYRQLLFGAGADPREHRVRITPEQLRQVMQERGELTLPMLLRCRVRYFSDGAIFGSQTFVSAQLAAQRKRCPHFLGKPQPLPDHLGCPDMVVLHRLRGPAVQAPAIKP